MDSPIAATGSSGNVAARSGSTAEADGGLRGTFITSGSFGPLAQRLVQRTHNPLVVGSNPTGPTTVSEPRASASGHSGPCQLCSRTDGIFVSIQTEVNRRTGLALVTN